jgi:protein SCO1
MNNGALKQIRLVLWIAVAIAAIGATYIFVFIRPSGPAVASIGGGSYNLVDQNGQPVTEAMFKGHPSALFFGFTHCPEVCPTTMAEMAGWFEALGDEGQPLRAYFVTVDPERDTPEILGDYVSWVSDRITGVTGDPAEIDKIIKAWGVFAEKVPTDDGSYTMNHTASVFLLNAQGEFEGTIAYGEDRDAALAKLRRLISA